MAVFVIDKFSMSKDSIGNATFLFDENSTIVPKTLVEKMRKEVFQVTITMAVGSVLLMIFIFGIVLFLRYRRSRDRRTNPNRLLDVAAS